MKYRPTLKQLAVIALAIAAIAAAIVTEQAFGATTTCPSLTTLNYPGSFGMRNYSATWSTARNAGTTGQGTTSIGSWTDGASTYFISRVALAFDTSNVPEENTVDAVTIWIYNTTNYVDTLVVQAIDTTTYSSTNYATAHFGQTLYPGSAIGGAGWTNFTLTTTPTVGKGAGGRTYLGIRDAADVGDSAPNFTVVNPPVLRYPGYGSQEPYLVVQSHTPTGGGGTTSSSTTVSTSEITTIAGVGPRDAGILAALFVGACLSLTVAAVRSKRRHG